MDKWIDLNEQSPEPNQMVLFYVPGIQGAYCYRFGLFNGKGYEISALGEKEYFAQIGPITHWIPLPDPPKNGKS